MRRVTKSEFIQLYNSIKNEALAPSGTWSLRMYDALFSSDFYFNKDDTNNWVSSLLDLLVDKKTCGNTKFKIAQLFSLMKTRNFNFIIETLDNKKETILNYCAIMGEFQLSNVIKKLLISLYINQNKITTSTPPPANPYFIKSVHMKKHSMSQTPDPFKLPDNLMDGAPASSLPADLSTVKSILE